MADPFLTHRAACEEEGRKGKREKKERGKGGGKTLTLTSLLFLSSSLTVVPRGEKEEGQR